MSDDLSPESNADCQVLSELPRGRVSLFDKIDLMLEEISKLPLDRIAPLYAVVMRKFYVEGMNLREVGDYLRQQGDPKLAVSNERVRTIVQSIRRELLQDDPQKRIYTKGIQVRREFAEAINHYANSSVGEVVSKGKLLTNPRMGAIAYIVNRRIVKNDTTMPWVKNNLILLNADIDKKVFNTYYHSLFYCLQREVRPLSFEELMRRLPQQSQWTNRAAAADMGAPDEALVKLVLSHSEVFEVLGDGSYQMRFSHLNQTQKFARIIYEEKDISLNDIIGQYVLRGGTGLCTCTSMVRRIYPWCVPVGKSKWIYKPDGQPMDNPAEVVRAFCMERVRFRFEEVMDHLSSMGMNIKSSSVRCYVMKYCRRRNDDCNDFCLTDHVPQHEDGQWYAKARVARRKRNTPWVDEVKTLMLDMLREHPEHCIRQNEVLRQCLPIFKKAGISKNNFYKIPPQMEEIAVEEREGKMVLRLR
ncbi:MAG: hypothetical protein ACI3YD_06450 [Alloprevotella sp.]